LREIINCDDTELAKLANNLKCYIGSKVSSNLIRGIVLDKITHNQSSTELVYYDNATNVNINSDFKLSILNEIKWWI
jgi:hypothetical protein